jgi:hypothetical protein
MRGDRALVLIGCLLAQVSDVRAQVPMTGTYVHEYAYSTPELIEDHFIVLAEADGELRGRYYGTSDEFDEAREGYLPGFFVAPMEGLVITGDQVAFTLNRPSRFFAAPVPLHFESVADIPSGLLDEWDVPLPAESRQYAGTLLGGEIVLAVPGGPRVFVRTEPGR